MDRKSSEGIGKMMELKPCPFCGKPLIIQEDSDHHGGYFSLGCADDPLGDDVCPGKALYYTEPIENLEKVVQLVNTRYEEWISVEERLPEKETTDLGEEYLCKIGGSYNIVAPLGWDGKNFFSGWISRTYWTQRVTHWKPLPKYE